MTDRKELNQGIIKRINTTPEFLPLRVLFSQGVHESNSDDYVQGFSDAVMFLTTQLESNRNLQKVRMN